VPSALPVPLEEVEVQLLADRAQIPGAVELWQQLSARRRRAELRRLSRSEQWRSQFEAALAAGERRVHQWAAFPLTEQREILSTIDLPPSIPFLRAWKVRSDIARAITRGVAAGSDYRRAAAPPVP
jgi:hypothetical protein